MSTTDASASTTRKYATASTRAGTLSRVITSWGGIVCVIVRRVTRTMRSAIGTSGTRPGPFCATQPAEPEHDTALVLAQDAHGRARKRHGEHHENHEHDEKSGHVSASPIPRPVGPSG